MKAKGFLSLIFVAIIGFSVGCGGEQPVISGRTQPILDQKKMVDVPAQKPSVAVVVLDDDIKDPLLLLVDTELTLRLKSAIRKMGNFRVITLSKNDIPLSRDRAPDYFVLLGRDKDNCIQIIITSFAKPPKTNLGGTRVDKSTLPVNLGTMLFASDRLYHHDQYDLIVNVVLEALEAQVK